MTEAKLYAALYRLVYATAHVARRARELYDDRWVVLVHLWGVVHDRSQSWSCDPANWPAETLDRPLISQSRLSRRLRTVGVLQLLDRLQAAACDLFPAPLVKAIDSKPLTVGAYSKDPDAKKKGRVADGQFAKGYRVHVVSYGRGVPRHWTLLPISEHDTAGAAALLPRLAGGGGYVVADNAYDSNALYALAAAAGHQLLAPAKAAHRHVRDAKHNCAARLRALDMLHAPLEACGAPPAAASAFGRSLYGRRQQVESTFGGLVHAGLGALPAFVRRPHRVAAWVAGKLLAFTVRMAVKRGLMA